MALANYDKDLAMMAATIAAGLMPAAEHAAREAYTFNRVDNSVEIRHDVVEIAVKVSEEIVSMLQDKRRKETVFNG